MNHANIWYNFSMKSDQTTKRAHASEDLIDPEDIRLATIELRVNKKNPHPKHVSVAVTTHDKYKAFNLHPHSLFVRLNYKPGANAVKENTRAHQQYTAYRSGLSERIITAGDATTATERLDLITPQHIHDAVQAVVITGNEPTPFYVAKQLTHMLPYLGVQSGSVIARLEEKRRTQNPITIAQRAAYKDAIGAQKITEPESPQMESEKIETLFTSVSDHARAIQAQVASLLEAALQKDTWQSKHRSIIKDVKKRITGIAPILEKVSRDVPTQPQASYLSLQNIAREITSIESVLDEIVSAA